jgi:hypothetical protein
VTEFLNELDSILRQKMKQLRFGPDFPKSHKFVEEQAHPEAKEIKRAKECNQPPVLASDLTRHRKPSNFTKIKSHLNTFDC